MKKILISLMIVAMIGMGCATTQKAGQENVPQEAQGPVNVPQGVSVPSPENVPQSVQGPGALAEKPPELVSKSKLEILAEKLEILAEKPPELVPGAKYVYKRTNYITGNSQISASTIKSKVNWMGTTPAYVVELSKQEGGNYVLTSYLVINTDLNILAILDKDGKLLEALKGITPTGTAPQANPADSSCIKIYDWPLTLGKNFTVEYEVLNKADNKSYKLTDQVSVDNELATVKLPLGTWTTYKIKRSTPGSNEVHYYSPEIGIEVKQEINQTLDNQAGAGVFVVELIGYNIPGVGQVGQAP